MNDTSLQFTPSVTSYTSVLSGKKPARIVCAVPHDGCSPEQFPNNYAKRTLGPTRNDEHAWTLAAFVREYAKELGSNIDLIRYLVPRAYVDANRGLTIEQNLGPRTKSQVALADSRLKDSYIEYHDIVRSHVQRSIEEYGSERVLFIDFHNFDGSTRIVPPQGYDVILGTAHRRTILHEPVDVRLALTLRRFRYRVFLPQVEEMPGGDPFQGGHTTRLIARDLRVNCIQVEVYRSWCTEEKKRAELAPKLARALIQSIDNR